MSDARPMVEKRLDGTSVVVVDDDRAVRESLAAAFRAEGADVREIGDGFDARVAGAALVDRPPIGTDVIRQSGENLFHWTTGEAF